MSYKILVIDHDPDSFEEMMRPLIGAGYEVVLATDADQGLDTFERMQPDLTMIEAFLPQRTGPELCDQLRQTEAGQSTPIVLIRDVDRGEDARQSLDGCDCNQIIDRPVSDEQLLDLCQRLLSAANGAAAPQTEDATVGASASTKETPIPPAANDESGDAAAADPDTFLNNEQLGDALGRLNLIIDGEADTPERKEVPGVAEQRGDFSYIAEELKSVADEPVAAASEEPQPAEVAKASPPPSGMTNDDLGDDISAHLDTLFGGGVTACPASDEKATASDDKPAAGDQPPPAETSAPTAVAAETAREPQASPEPPVETTAGPAPAAVRPAPPRVAQSQTEAAVPPPIRKTPPTAAKTAVLHEAAAGRSKLWLVAASIAVVILGGAFALFFMRGSSPDPVAAIPDTPARDSSGSQAIASAGLPTRDAAPSLPVTLPQLADANDSKDSLVDSSEATPKPQTAPAKVAKPDPPKPAPRTSAPPKPKRTTPPKPKRTTEATAKPAPKVSTPPAEPKPTPPKPATASPPAAVETAPTTTTARATSPTAGDAEKTTSPPTPSPERVEPVTETARLTPRSEPPPPPTSTPASTPVQRTPAATPAPSEPTAPVSKPEPVFRPPVVVERVEPVYSRKARKKDERGTIVINVLVAENGSIARVVVDKGIPGSELEAAAMNAVVRWKFKPATDGGKPVKAWTKAQFVFD